MTKNLPQLQAKAEATRLAMNQAMDKADVAADETERLMAIAEAAWVAVESAWKARESARETWKTWETVTWAAAAARAADAMEAAKQAQSTADAAWKKERVIVRVAERAAAKAERATEAVPWKLSYRR